MIIWHVLGWAFAFTLFNRRLFLFGFSNATVFNLITFFLYPLIFYWNIFRIFPLWNKHKKASSLLSWWMGFLLISLIVTILIAKVIGMFSLDVFNKFQLLTVFLKNIFYVCLSLFLSAAYYFVVQWFENERVRFKLENEKLQMELDFLRSQINPHFLFNTLNNIYALTQERPGKAAEALLKLSDILHFILYECQADKIKLTKELEHLRLIMALHQLRIPGPMMLEFVVDIDSQKYEIAPLILVSFVENLLKHGVLGDDSDPALIKIRVEDCMLDFYSKNKIKQFAKIDHNRIGLINIKRRLELLYMGKYQLDISNDGDSFSVHLNMKLQ